MLKPLTGSPIAFESFKGKWVFINYWASWCRACVDEISVLNQLNKVKGKQSVALFAVNYDQLDEQEQIQLVQQFHLHYPSLGQDPAEILHLGDIEVLPMTFIFDPSGALHDTLYGQQPLEIFLSYLR